MNQSRGDEWIGMCEPGIGCEIVSELKYLPNRISSAEGIHLLCDSLSIHHFLYLEDIYDLSIFQMDLTTHDMER